MKTNMLIKIWIGCMIVFIPLFVLGQDEPLITRMDLTCIQEMNKEVSLSAKLRAKDGRSYVPVKGEKIMFTGLQDEEYVDLGSAVTDGKGDAIISIKDLSLLSQDEDGYYTVSASYEGSDKYEGNEEEFMFLRGFLDMETSDDSGTKSIEIIVYSVENDEQIPIAEVEARVSVPMLFSNLPIGSDYTDGEGKLQFEFPDDLPGDSEGNITLMAEAPETDDYGILRATQVKNWGIPKAEVVEKTRTLWSPDAPLWMVVTFIVLMLAVWGHFMYIIYRLFLMSRDGKLAINGQN